MGDILTEIDATVDGLCACGCETKLDEASRSGWWATETCHAGWQGRLAQDGSNSAAAEGRPALNLDVFRIRTDECWWLYNLTAPGVLEALQRWLAANRLDPAEVRQAGERHVIEDGWLRVECFVADSAANFLLDDAGEVRTVLRSVPLVEPLPDRMEVSPHSLRLNLDASGWTEGVEQAGAALRRVGDAIGATVGAYAGLPTSLRQTIEADLQAESDRVALRAVCNDEAMYERALVKAEERGWPVRAIFEAVAMGQYTADGWIPVDPQPRVFWSPRIADPDAPTMAELQGGIDLTPYFGQPTFGQDAAAIRAAERLRITTVASAAQQTLETYQRPSLRTRSFVWCVAHWGIIRRDGLRRWLASWPKAWRRRRWAAWLRWMLGGCPGHRRRTCVVCDWVRGNAAERRLS